MNELLSTIDNFCVSVRKTCSIDPEFSFGHIVLSDYNLDNRSIDFCLEHKNVTRWLMDRHDDGERDNWMYYSQDSLLKASMLIKTFLEWLKTIPENERENIMDEYDEKVFEAVSSVVW